MKNDLVKKSYNTIALEYAAKRDQVETLKYLEKFIVYVKKGRTILDVGCGAGKPIDSYLVKQGYAVNGIDVSENMIKLAKQNVTEAFYEVKDMTKLQSGEYCVDGIVSFYAIFHTPRERHQEILNTFASFMPNGGPLLITMGASVWEGTEENFYGAKMIWSHYSSLKNREMVERAGFSVILDEIDTSGGEKHQVILALRK